MDNITIIQGHDLWLLLHALDEVEQGEIHTLRINQRPDGIAYKVNSGMWTPTVGRRADAGGY